MVYLNEGTVNFLKDNPFDFAEGAQEQWVDYNPWTEFWLKVEQEWAEQEKQRIMYEMEMGYYNDKDESEEETCDYTGDECFGNKLFCEECEVLTGEEEEE